MSQAPILGFGCAICSDTFDINVQRNICTIPQCGHVYHEYCVKRWFRTQIRQGIPSNCPKCRIPAMESQIIRLFLHETICGDNDATEEVDEDENNDNNNDSLTASEIHLIHLDDVLELLELERVEAEADFSDGNHHLGSPPPLQQMVPMQPLPLLIPAHAQTNNTPNDDINSQQGQSISDNNDDDDDDDDDVNGAAPFNEWVAPSYPALNDHAYSLYALDQHLLSLDTDFSLMSDMVNRLESYIQTFH